MSFFGLNLAGGALDAFQQAANTTSNNIANVNTPGASRQRVNLTEASPIVGSPGYATWSGPGTKGDGVTVASITRVHQDSYDSLFRGASASQNYYTVQEQQLSAVQSAFAEPRNGINRALSNLQTSLSQLSANPAGTPERQGVIGASQAFVTAVNQVADAISTAKATAIQQTTTVVTQANTIIDQIASLNGQIRASTAVGDNPNTYKDQRDLLVDQLSTLLATQSSIQSNGSTLVTVGGRALVNDTQAYHLAAPVTGKDSSGNPMLVIGFSSDPNPSNPVPVQLGSGQLGGYVDLYNNSLTPYGQKLDAFANATASEIDRVFNAGYDQNGNPGISLLQPLVQAQAISASNIKVGITDPAQVPGALASTAAGSLTAGMNAADNTVNTAASMLSNPTMYYQTGATQTGSLTVKVDGVNGTYAYDFSAAGKDNTVDGFISGFNAAQLGVNAQFDHTSQKIIFSRDPNNVSLAHRAAVATAGTSVTPDFTITDSNAPAPIPAAPPGQTAVPQGTVTASLLQLIGAAGTNGVGIDGIRQDNTNAFGAGDNGAANAALRAFTKNVGVPALQTTAGVTVPAAVVPGNVTVTEPAAGAYAQIRVGAVLTIDAQPGSAAPQEDVVVTAVNRTTGTITFGASLAHAAGFSITSAQSQTLGTYYGGIVGQLGLDTSTASTGTTSQTKLASSIDQVRQGIDGINLDEETQNLIKYQNAYAAAAKTLNVVEQLITTALGLIPGG